MSNSELINLFIAIFALIVSALALIWSWLSYKKSKNHEFYSLINNKLKELCFVKLQKGLDSFIDLESLDVNSDKYDDVGNVLLEISDTVSVLKYIELTSYNRIIHCITEMDNICIAFSNKKRITVQDKECYIEKINSLIDAINCFYKKH